MPLRALRNCLISAAGAAAFLMGALPAPAADVSIAATLGIGGRYRPDTWFPVSVTVKNNGGQALRGQVEVLAKPVAGNQSQGRYIPRASALYAVPLTTPADRGVPHTVTVYVRGLDPVRDNLTVQFVDGQERGGGQVFAGASVFTSLKSTAITGSQINGSDLFLIGVSDDPNAFHFLRAGTCGLLHTRSGPRSLETFPQQINGTKRSSGIMEVSTPVPSSLPDRPAGYSGVDAVLLRADSSIDQLTEPQVDALKAWVGSGGHLVVMHGPSDAALHSSGLKDLIPAGVDGSAGTADVLSAGRVPVAILKPERDAVTILSAGGAPIAVSRNYGAGIVMMAAPDLTSAPFQFTARDDQKRLWKTILSCGVDTPETLLAYAAQYEEGAVATYNSSRLSDAVLRIAAFDTPSTAFVALFLLVYVIVLVPLNYLVLKRMDRKEWAWGTIPAMVLLFAGGTYAAGYFTRGSSQFVNQVTLLETSAGQHIAGAYDAFGMFSSRHASYDLQLNDANALASVPSLTRYGYYGGSQDDVNTYGAARFVQTGSATKIQDAALDMWAMRTFDSQSARDLGGVVDAQIKAAGGRFTGTVTNHTQFALTHCVVVYGTQQVDLGTIAPGGSRPIALAPQPKSAPAVKAAPGNVYPGAPQYTPGPTPALATVGGSGDDANASIEERMRRGALGFLGEIAANDPNQYGLTGLNDEPVARIGDSRDHALFIASSADPALSGAPIKVDGEAITQHRAVILAVHIPMTE